VRDTICVSRRSDVGVGDSLCMGGGSSWSWRSGGGVGRGGHYGLYSRCSVIDRRRRGLINIHGGMDVLDWGDVSSRDLTSSQGRLVVWCGSSSSHA
jgi:hypothetical protein